MSRVQRPIDMTLTKSGLVDCCSELQSEALPMPSTHSSVPGLTCALILAACMRTRLQAVAPDKK